MTAGETTGIGGSGRRLMGCALRLALIALLAPSGAAASSYTNPAPITIPALGAAAPYPSTISVSGLPEPRIGGPPEASALAPNLGARVTLTGLSHTFPDDIDVLLVGPSAKSLLMSDACDNPDLVAVNLTFDDAAGALLPNAPVSPCVSGTYRPTDYEPGDILPAPAPPGSYGAQLSLFGPGSPNGLWQLFVSDDTGSLDGSIAGGWSLELLPVAYCGERRYASTVAANAGTAGNDVMRGTSGADVLFGFGGNDTISGLGGNDVICGGPGKDTLKGGPGRDYLRGELGKDKLKGQGGKDTCNGGPRRDTATACEKTKDV